jgi:ATP-dependent DNA helicase RecG
LRGVGGRRAAVLARLGLRRVSDLLRHAPRTYEVWGAARAIREVRRGEEVTVRGRVIALRLHRIGKGRTLLRVRLSDGTGEIEALFFNQPYLRDRFRAGEEAGFHGRVGGRKGLALLAPKVESRERPFPEEGEISPVYPRTAGAGEGLLRSLLAQALPLAPDVPEPLPEETRAALDLPRVGSALHEIHSPSSLAEVERARRRLAFDELLELQRRFARSRARAKRAPAVRILVDRELDRRIRARLPFPLTPGQERAVAELRADLGAGAPMRRLLQGDVGCGKTVVAFYACLAAVGRGLQAAFLAPTAVLAEQQREVFAGWLRGSRVRLECLAGAPSVRERRAAREALGRGEVHLLLGTHALLAEGVRFRSLSLAVIDEQHRFGVAQRSALLAKGVGVHALALSATPIPRTLAMALFGDLEVSTIPDLPAGRGRRETRIAPSREAVVSEVRRRVLEGEKGFWVCPRIGGGEPEGEEPEAGARAADQVFRRFVAREFRGIPLGVLHGRRTPEERAEALRRFRAGDVRLLVCTSVVEVGIDVPDATLLVVEGAEGFGLAALHQLRGRVGRGGADATCILLAGQGELGRLRILERSEDGFEIAEEDLRRRGPGEIFGLRQSGFPEFRFADPARDVDLLRAAREVALSAGSEGTILHASPAAVPPASPRATTGSERETPRPCSPS